MEVFAVSIAAGAGAEKGAPALVIYRVCMLLARLDGTNVRRSLTPGSAPSLAASSDTQAKVTSHQSVGVVQVSQFKPGPKLHKWKAIAP